MKKNCPICDELIDEHVQECPYCHEKTGFEPAAPAQPAKPAQPVRNESNALQWVIIILLVIAISVLFYFLFRPMPGYQSEPVQDEVVSDSDEVAQEADSLIEKKATRQQQTQKEQSQSTKGTVKRSLTEKEKEIGEQYYEPVE